MKAIDTSVAFLAALTICILSTVAGEPIPAAVSVLCGFSYISFQAWLNKRHDETKKELEERLRKTETRLENIEQRLNFQ